MRFVKVAAAAALALSLFYPTQATQAQDYPSRPIEVIVTWGPGGGADQTGRQLAKLMEPLLKVSMPVENVAGSAGVTGITKLINGQAEGYQVGILTADSYGLLADPKSQRWSLKDLDPIAILIVQRSGFFVKADSPLKTWADVEAKAKTSELKVAITGLDTPDDIAVQELGKRGLKFNSVPFAKPGERYAAVVGGHADLLYEQAGDIRSFIEGSQLRPILFLSSEKVVQFPDVTTTKDLGVNLVLDQFRTVVAKAGTPPERLKLLFEKVAEATKSEEYKSFLDKQWADPKSVVVGPAAREYIQREVDALKKYVK
jgi:tripartite-type tricarboxylate transporter receptor subunit TctC